jgi:hypothetical protein
MDGELGFTYTLYIRLLMHITMKTNVEKLLQRELEILNHSIDMKIIKGVSYAKEARRHKYLLARLLSSKKASRSSFFSRLSFPTPFLYR